jgi:hypothetical protein
MPAPRSRRRPRHIPITRARCPRTAPTWLQPLKKRGPVRARPIGDHSCRSAAAPETHHLETLAPPGRGGVRAALAIARYRPTPHRSVLVSSSCRSSASRRSASKAGREGHASIERRPGHCFVLTCPGMWQRGRGAGRHNTAGKAGGGAGGVNVKSSPEIVIARRTNSVTAHLPQSRSRVPGRRGDHLRQRSTTVLTRGDPPSTPGQRPFQSARSPGSGFGCLGGPAALGLILHWPA